MVNIKCINVFALFYIYACMYTCSSNIIMPKAEFSLPWLYKGVKAHPKTYLYNVLFIGLTDRSQQVSNEHKEMCMGS